MITTSIRTAFTAAALGACVAAPAGAATYPTGFEERAVATGLTQAVAVDWAPDNTSFIAEKPRRVKVLEPGSSTPRLVLDISDHVNESIDRGLNGIAVDKSFETNGYVYLTYVYDLLPMTPDSDSPMVSRVTRIEMQDGELQNPASPETVLLGTYVTGPCPAAPTDSIDCIPADQDSHTMGTVRAAEDGSLWVGTGDASRHNVVDPSALRALDEKSLAGKILHVNANGQGLATHGFCPGDANLSHNCTKIHAKGFRNPFRFHFRTGEGGLSVADVGWNTREEMNLIGQAGKSYGWPCYEATIRTPGYEDLRECQAFYAQEGTPQAQRSPDYDYGRDEGGSIIGGPTYTDDQYPTGFRDSLFFGDFSSFTLRRVSFDTQGDPVVTAFADEWLGTDLEIGPGGDLYYVSPGDFSDGTASLQRVVYTPGNASPVARARATPGSGPAPLAVQFSASASTDADGDALSYEWDFGDGTRSTAAEPAKTYANPGSYVVQLTVKNGRGLKGTDSVTVTPGDTPPSLSVQAPGEGTQSTGGETVALSASATDAQDTTAPRVDWTIRRCTDSGMPIGAPGTRAGRSAGATREARDGDRRCSPARPTPGPGASTALTTPSASLVPYWALPAASRSRAG